MKPADRLFLRGNSNTHLQCVNPLMRTIELFGQRVNRQSDANRNHLRSQESRFRDALSPV